MSMTTGAAATTRRPYMNKVEWAELHHRLAGREVPVADQLEYFFDAAPAWCGPDPRRE